MAVYQGRGKCDRCGSSVEVYTDKNRLAYYKCGPCGILLRHTKPQKSQAHLSEIDRYAEEGAAPDEIPTPKPQGEPGNPGPVDQKNPPAAPKKKTAFKFPSLV